MQVPVYSVSNVISPKFGQNYDFNCQSVTKNIYKPPISKLIVALEGMCRLDKIHSLEK